MNQLFKYVVIPFQLLTALSWSLYIDQSRISDPDTCQ